METQEFTKQDALEPSLHRTHGTVKPGQEPMPIPDALLEQKTTVQEPVQNKEKSPQEEFGMENLVKQSREAAKAIAEINSVPATTTEVKELVKLETKVKTSDLNAAKAIREIKTTETWMKQIEGRAVYSAWSKYCPDYLEMSADNADQKIKWADTLDILAELNAEDSNIPKHISCGAANEFSEPLDKDVIREIMANLTGKPTGEHISAIKYHLMMWQLQFGLRAAPDFKTYQSDLGIYAEYISTGESKFSDLDSAVELAKSGIMPKRENILAVLSGDRLKDACVKLKQAKDEYDKAQAEKDKAASSRKEASNKKKAAAKEKAQKEADRQDEIITLMAGELNTSSDLIKLALDKAEKQVDKIMEETATTVPTGEEETAELSLDLRAEILVDKILADKIVKTPHAVSLTLLIYNGETKEDEEYDCICITAINGDPVEEDEDEDEEPEDVEDLDEE